MLNLKRIPGLRLSEGFVEKQKVLNVFSFQPDFQMLHRTETVLLKVCNDLLLVADRPELALHCGILVFTLDSCAGNKGAALE